MNNLPEGWNQNKIDEREEWQRRHMKEELKRAITHFNSWLDSIKRYADCPHDKATVMHGHVLISLAKTFLSVSVEMPTKYDLSKCNDTCHCAGDISYTERDLHEAENLIIDQCTLVATRLVAEKEAEVEKLRMQLVACGIAAMCNTKKSIKEQGIDKTNPYWSESYQDVCDAVQREMNLMVEIDALKKELEKLKGESNG